MTQHFSTLVTVTSHFYHVQQKIGIDTLKRLNKFKSTDSYIYMNTFHGIKKCIHCYQQSQKNVVAHNNVTCTIGRENFSTNRNKHFILMCSRPMFLGTRSLLVYTGQSRHFVECMANLYPRGEVEDLRSLFLLPYTMLHSGINGLRGRNQNNSPGCRKLM